MMGSATQRNLAKSDSKSNKLYARWNAFIQPRIAQIERIINLTQITQNSQIDY